MTTYTGFGAGTPAGISYGADTSRYTLATAFKVTSSGLSLTKGRIYLSSNGGAVTAADVLDGTSLEFTLFPQTDGAFSVAGAMTPQLFSPVLLGSLTMDAWNEFVLPSPFALTAGTVYYASVYLPAGRYAFIGSEFSSADVVAGPITFPQHDTALPGLGRVTNGGFVGGGTGLQPVNNGTGTWYGIDIEVSDGGTTFDAAGTVAASSSATGAVAAQLLAGGTVAATSESSGVLSSLLLAEGVVAAVSSSAGDASALSQPQTYSASGRVDAVSSSSGAASRWVVTSDPLGQAMQQMLPLAEALLAPEVGRAALYPGAEVAWDDCCDGQLWLRVVDVVPSGLDQRPSANPCPPPMWRVTFGLGVLRCVGVVDDNGDAPSPARLTADTLQSTADRAALARAIQCGFGEILGRVTFVRWLPLGPMGACAGGEWLFTGLVGNCPCP